jgi:hypothetical protein
MSNKAFEVYKGLPSWAKGVVVIGGIAIVYFTTKSFLKRIKQSAEKKKDMEVVVEQKKELDILVKDGVYPTFSGSQYKAWADALQKQFDGCDPSIRIPLLAPTSLWNSQWSGSGAKLVNIIYKFKNDADFLQLSQAYGVRTYDQCGWGTGNFTGSLAAAISDELDESEINAINQALSKQGIKYKF